jgi:hypothetical protein
MKNVHRKIGSGLAGLVLVLRVEAVSAVEIEPLGKAVAGLLGTTKAFKKTETVDGRSVTVFYSKGSDGKAARMAFIEQGVYAPDCSHRWAVGINEKGAVTGVRVLEMSCPHAFPCKEASFLEQYVGKVPADAPKLKGSVSTIAKATGSSELTTDAVVRSLTAYAKLKGKF